MTFKYLLLPYCVFANFPLNFDKCVFVSSHKVGIVYPPKWARRFPNAKQNVQNCLFYGEVQKEPLKFLKALYNWIKVPA